jgi:transposase InsO family protein
MMGVDELCRSVGMSRSNYYKVRRVRERRRIEESLVLDLVAGVRAAHPNLGTRKLLGRLRGELDDAGVSMGRDRFFELLSANDLLIRRKARSVRTTWSNHGLRHWPDSAKSLDLTGPNQLWVSDITYLRLVKGFAFLALVMDAWSRAIVGYDCSDSLEMEGALRALTMAIDSLPEDARPMHHSDRGCQYCASAYIQTLQRHEMGISMTEGNHCCENAKAERLNGILKQEYGLGETLVNTVLARRMSQQAVRLYNTDRPHGAIGNRVPMEVHRGLMRGSG